MTYFRDWFGRDADYGYTHYDPNKRAYSWDKGYTNYSDFFFGHSKRLNMEEAASLLTTMSKVVGIDASKFTGKNSTTRAYIPAEMLANGISTDIFIGAALQNIAKVMHEDVEEHAKMLLISRREKPTLNHFILKVLNEERINSRMAVDTPGYLKFIKKYKDHKYTDRPVPSNDYEHLLELFDRIIRYPDQITEEELLKFKDPIDKIKSILSKEGGIPDGLDSCVKVSKKIADVITQYVKPPKDETPDDEDEGGKGISGDGESGEDESDSSTDSSKTTKPTEFMKNMMKAMQEQYKSEESIESFTKFMQAIKTAEEISKKGASKVDVVSVIDTDESRNRYADIIKEIDLTKANVIGTLLRRKSRDYQFSLKSMRSGRLDTNKLAEASQHVSTIYERVGQVKTNKLCVTILVDESGSMGGNKIEQARKAAIFLNECLKDVTDVELFIYGHTADWDGDGVYPCSGTGTTQLLVYKEPGSPQKTALGSMTAKYENRDGSAIIGTAKRVRSKTLNNGILIVISDGAPCAQNYRGDPATTHTRKMVNEVEKMGFQVIQVAIDGYESKNMFKNIIHMKNMSTFPADFVGFLRSKINVLIKEKIVL